MNNDYNNFQPQGPQPGQGAATGSLVCGIISLVAGIVFGWTFFMSFAGLVVAIVGIVLAVNAKKQGFNGGNQTVGLVLGIIGAVINSVVFVSCVACVCISSAIINEYYYSYFDYFIDSITGYST